MTVQIVLAGYVFIATEKLSRALVALDSNDLRTRRPRNRPGRYPSLTRRSDTRDVGRLQCEPGMTAPAARFQSVPTRPLPEKLQYHRSSVPTQHLDGHVSPLTRAHHVHPETHRHSTDRPERSLPS